MVEWGYLALDGSTFIDSNSGVIRTRRKIRDDGFVIASIVMDKKGQLALPPMISNIRLYTRDARELIEALPDACLDSVFILFPDPWPKLRHNKRRLVSAQTLSMLARTHKKGGRLLIATDHVDYSVWMLEVLLNHPDYSWTAREQADWKNPPKDWTM